MRIVHDPLIRLLLFGASALTAATALLPGAAVPAAAATAAQQPATPFAGQAYLAADSCKGPSWCMAVGSYTTTDHVRHSLAMIFNGTSWRSLKNPPGKRLGQVACSSTTFCMAAGGPTAPNDGTARPGGRCRARKGAWRADLREPHILRAAPWQRAEPWNGRRGATRRCPTSVLAALGPCGLRERLMRFDQELRCGRYLTISRSPCRTPSRTSGTEQVEIRPELPANGNPAQLNAVSVRGRSACRLVSRPVTAPSRASRSATSTTR
jgi:hypothetical protein